MASYDYVTVTLGMPRLLREKMEAAASPGTVSEWLMDVGCEKLGMDNSRMRRRRNFIHLARKELARQVTLSGGSYPPDVIMDIFRALKGDPQAVALHDEVTREGVSEVAALHQRVGAEIKRQLGAEVVGRSREMDPMLGWVRTYSLLAPPTPPAGPASV